MLMPALAWEAEAGFCEFKAKLSISLLQLCVIMCRGGVQVSDDSFRGIVPLGLEVPGIVSHPTCVGNLTQIFWKGSPHS